METMLIKVVGRIKKILTQIPYLFEVIISVLMLLVIMTETFFLVQQILIGTFDFSVEPMKLNQLMDSILWVVIGLEFVRMLLEHSHGAVLEIMLFAVARQMIVAHTSMQENLLAVMAIAGIFGIRKYLYSK